MVGTVRGHQKTMIDWVLFHNYNCQYLWAMKGKGTENKKRTV